MCGRKVNCIKTKTTNTTSRPAIILTINNKNPLLRRKQSLNWNLSIPYNHESVKIKLCFLNRFGYDSLVFQGSNGFTFLFSLKHTLLSHLYEHENDILINKKCKVIRSYYRSLRHSRQNSYRKYFEVTFLVIHFLSSLYANSPALPLDL